jgi:hypothetical protein
MCSGVESWCDRFQKVCRMLSRSVGSDKQDRIAISLKQPASTRSKLGSRDQISEVGQTGRDSEVCGSATWQAISSTLPAGFVNDSTPDETAVSIESASGRKRLTISSGGVCGKHMTISPISVILSKFRRKAVSRSAALLPVPRRVRPFAEHRFCGSCGSGKPRRPDC